LGHRREIFRPRIRKSKIESQVNTKLKEKKFNEAVQVTLSHYTGKSVADAFAVSILATAEAIIIAKDKNWDRSIEEFALNGIKNAEKKIHTKLVPFRKQVVFELVTKSLRKEYKMEGSS